jgi:hypothetical protein
MARADGRVTPGQNIATAFSARAWNRAQDAADLVLGKSLGALGAQSNAYDRAPNIITLRNDTGLNIDRFNVVAIQGVIVHPESSDYARRSFEQRPVLRGIRPTRSDGDRFAVCIEPIAAGDFGRAVIRGMFACKVRVNDLRHQYATILNNDMTQLQTTTCGRVLLLWVDTTNRSPPHDDTWAVGVI